MLTNRMCVVLSSAMALAGVSAAQAADKPAAKTTLGVSVNATVLTGFGLSVGTALGEDFNVRGVANGFSISKDFDQDQGSYTGKVKLFTAGILADWMPFNGAFRVTAGLVDNGNKITLDGKPKNGTYTVGDCSYTSDPSDPLKIRGETHYKSLAPYAGLGWGGNMSAEPGFYGTFDIGVLFSGSADIKLDASGHAVAPGGACGTGTIDVASDPNFQAQRQKAEDDANDNVGNYKLWPAIGFGVGWRF